MKSISTISDCCQIIAYDMLLLPWPSIMLKKMKDSAIKPDRKNSFYAKSFMEWWNEMIFGIIGGSWEQPAPQTIN